MNYKKILISISLLFLLIPTTNTIASTYIENMDNGDYIFYLTNVTINKPLELTLNRGGNGNFTLFVFNSRPVDSNVDDDNSLKATIFNNPPTVAYNLDDNPYINYTSPEEKIYYIEIILVSGGQDFYTLTSNYDLTRYYLPLIPGFQVGVVVSILAVSIGLLIVLYKKRNIKIS